MEDKQILRNLLRSRSSVPFSGTEQQLNRVFHNTTSLSWVQLKFCFACINKSNRRESTKTYLPQEVYCLETPCLHMMNPTPEWNKSFPNATVLKDKKLEWAAGWIWSTTAPPAGRTSTLPLQSLPQHLLQISNIVCMCAAEASVATSPF